MSNDKQVEQAIGQIENTIQNTQDTKDEAKEDQDQQTQQKQFVSTDQDQNINNSINTNENNNIQSSQAPLVNQSQELQAQDLGAGQNQQVNAKTSRGEIQDQKADKYQESINNQATQQQGQIDPVSGQQLEETANESEANLKTQKDMQGSWEAQTPLDSQHAPQQVNDNQGDDQNNIDKYSKDKPHEVKPMKIDTNQQTQTNAQGTALQKEPSTGIQNIDGQLQTLQDSQNYELKQEDVQMQDTNQNIEQRPSSKPASKPLSKVNSIANLKDEVHNQNTTSGAQQQYNELKQLSKSQVLNLNKDIDLFNQSQGQNQNHIQQLKHQLEDQKRRTEQLQLKLEQLENENKTKQQLIDSNEAQKLIAKNEVVEVPLGVAVYTLKNLYNSWANLMARSVLVHGQTWPELSDIQQNKASLEYKYKIKELFNQHSINGSNFKGFELIQKVYQDKLYPQDFLIESFRAQHPQHVILQEQEVNRSQKLQESQKHETPQDRVHDGSERSSYHRSRRDNSSSKQDYHQHRDGRESQKQNYYQDNQKTFSRNNKREREQNDGEYQPDKTTSNRYNNHQYPQSNYGRSKSYIPANNRKNTMSPIKAPDQQQQFQDQQLKVYGEDGYNKHYNIQAPFQPNIEPNFVGGNIEPPPPDNVPLPRPPLNISVAGGGYPKQLPQPQPPILHPPGQVVGQTYMAANRPGIIQSQPLQNLPQSLSIPAQSQMNAQQQQQIQDNNIVYESGALYQDQYARNYNNYSNNYGGRNQ